VTFGKTALALTTGFGLRAFVKRHKRLAWVIIALVVLNEIRGLAVVSAIAWAWWQP
jgi:hypothetical protein